MVPTLLDVIALSISECEAVVVRTGTTGGKETAIGLCQIRYFIWCQITEIKRTSAVISASYINGLVHCLLGTK